MRNRRHVIRVRRPPVLFTIRQLGGNSKHVTFFAERERIGNDEDGGKDGKREDQQNQNKNNDEDTTER